MLEWIRAVLMYQRHAEERAAPVRRRLVSEERDPENQEDAPARPPDISQACACRAGISATGICAGFFFLPRGGACQSP